LIYINSAPTVSVYLSSIIEKESDMFKKILITTDGSELGQKAVSSGIALASSLNARVVFLRIVPRYPTAYFEGAVVLNPADIGRIEDQWNTQAQKTLNDACEVAQRHAIKATAVTVKSDLVAESIIATAKKQKCDVIVMASHGYKGFKRLLLGSETLNVLTHTHIPVLVLR
jgi:nucleotide-binding universal stress UspA family protein